MEGDYCYRIPTIVRTAAGTLLAFAEQVFYLAMPPFAHK
jgi:hypothetical protein